MLFSMNSYRLQYPLLPQLSKHKWSSSLIFIHLTYSLGPQNTSSLNQAWCFEGELDPDPTFQVFTLQERMSYMVHIWYEVVDTFYFPSTESSSKSKTTPYSKFK